MAATTDTTKSSRLVQAAAFIVIVAALHFAKDVLVPLCLAVLLTFLLSPVVRQLERLKLTRAVAVAVTMALALLLAVAIGFLVNREVHHLADNLEAYRAQIVQRVHELRQHTGIAGRFASFFHEVQHAVVTSQPASPVAEERPPAAAPSTSTLLELSAEPVKTLLTIFTPAMNAGATIFIVGILVIFMLLEREDLRDRVLRLVGEGQINLTTVAMDDAARRVSTYLLLQTMINAEYGALVGIGLSVLHIPNALLWGLLAGLLRFLPYVGPWLGAVIPVLLSFADARSWGVLNTVALFALLEVINGSFIEPWLYGRRTGVSSVAVLVAAIFWFWLWGPVGLILSTPLTVIMAVIGKYVPQLSFFAILLGDEPVFEPHVRYYQRLIAQDQEEGLQILEEYNRQHGIEQLYENLLVPSLSLFEQDRHRGKFDDDKERFITAVIKEHLEELAELSPSHTSQATEHDSSAKTGSNSSGARLGDVVGSEQIKILCVPARDVADELAGMMLASLLRQRGFDATALSATVLAGEMLDSVEQQHSDIVVISALPPAGTTHARYLCKRLYARFAQVRLMVGLWNYRGNIAATTARISCAASTSCVTSFAQATEQIGQLMHPIALGARDNSAK